MSKLPETYLYEVMAVRRPIKLECGVEIYTPKSVYLTKEDVKQCLQVAYLNRRFANHEPVRVTVANLDRLHNPNFISEEEWNNKTEEPDEKIEEPEVIEEVVEETAPEIVQEDTKIDSDTVEEEADEPEEVVELTSTSGDDEKQEESEESKTDDVSIEDNVEEEIDEEPAEETKDEDVVEENKPVADLEEDNETGVSQKAEHQPTQQNNAKYTYKKHHKGKH